MNINLYLTKLYGSFHLHGRRKNKPKTNPIKPNFTIDFELEIGLLKANRRTRKEKNRSFYKFIITCQNAEPGMKTNTPFVPF
jgi:hypothetical protein